MKIELKNEAIRLRKEGWSYAVISKQIQIPKGTLSNWLRNIPYAPNEEVTAAIKAGPLKSALSRNKSKLNSIASAKGLAKEEVGSITQRDLFLLGLGIYMGEGHKALETVRISNANPDIIKLAVLWLKGICGLGTENLTLAIHLYPDSDQQKALSYWSELTGIPLSQFGKTQLDARSGKSPLKHGKTPHGTAHLTVRSCKNPAFGVFLHRRIMGWIECACEQAGIV